MNYRRSNVINSYRKAGSSNFATKQHKVKNLETRDKIMNSEGQMYRVAQHTVKFSLAIACLSCQIRLYCLLEVYIRCSSGFRVIFVFFVCINILSKLYNTRVIFELNESYQIRLIEPVLNTSPTFMFFFIFGYNFFSYIEDYLLRIINQSSVSGFG